MFLKSDYDMMIETTEKQIALYENSLRVMDVEHPGAPTNEEFRAKLAELCDDLVYFKRMRGE